MPQIYFTRKKLFLLLYIILIFLLVDIVTGYEQRTGWAWHKKYASDHGLMVGAVQQTLDGGYLLGGGHGAYILASNRGDYSWGVLLIKTDAMGNLEWSKEFDEKTLYMLDGLSISPDGGYFLAGYTPSNQHPYSIIKTDSKGNFIWNVNIDTAASNLHATSDGGCVYTTTTQFLPGIGYKVEIGKIDRNGVVQWSQKNRNPDAVGLKSIILTSDGGLLIGLSGLSEKIELIKTDFNGEEQWSKFYDYVDLFALQQTDDGGYSLVYQTYNTGGGFSIGYAKLDSKGVIQRTQAVNEHIPDFNPNNKCVYPAQNGEFILLNNNALYKMNAAGNIDWMWTFKESDDIEQIFSNELLKASAFQAFVGRQINTVQQTSDGGYILAGLYHLAENTGECPSYFECKFIIRNEDAWLIKIDKNNNPSPRTETSDRIFISSEKLPGLPGFDMVLSLIGLVIAAIYCIKKKYT